MEKTIGETIREWRRQAGMSQEALGVLMHCTQRTVQRLERAGNRVRISTLVQAAGLLGKEIRITIEAVRDESKKAG